MVLGPEYSLKVSSLEAASPDPLGFPTTSGTVGHPPCPAPRAAAHVSVAGLCAGPARTFVHSHVTL